MTTALRKTFHIRVNGIAASRDFARAVSPAVSKALTAAIEARPDAVIELVEMYGDTQLGAFVVYRPTNTSCF